MYLVNHSFKQNADRIKVFADWRTRFHKPAAVWVSVGEPSGLGAPDNTLLIDGPVKDVHGALFGCAEIAWSLGWRPRGLMPSLMAFIQGFKVHPMVRPGQ